MERNIRTNGTVSVIALLIAAAVVFATAHISGSISAQVAVVFLVLGFFAAAISRFQMRLETAVELEKLELEELARKSAETALFKGGEEDELYPARRAREQFEKYAAPGAAVLTLVLQALGVWWLWQWLGRQEAPKLARPEVCLAIFGFCALTLFLLGRVSAGIARLGKQHLLRPGAGYLLLGAYLCAAVGAATGASIADYPKVDLYVARAMVVLLGLVAVENALTLLLEIYRPRVKGAARRLLQESRLVGLVSQPEGLFTTAAHALDYQFGFKVSETWFYQFLQRYLGYFILAQVAVLLLSSCVVFIEPGEQGFLERFGRPAPRLLNPGGHLKWPWPVDQVYRYQTDRIQTFMIGHAEHEEEADKDDGHGHGRKPKRDAAAADVELWSVGHFENEYNMLVARRETAESKVDKAVPANLVAANVPVQFQVTNLLMWATNHADGAELLERAANREVVRYLISADLNELLTTGRNTAAEEMRKRIQEQANELGLGVRILYVGLQNIHPPVAIAPAYQEVVGAMLQKTGMQLDAEAYAAQTLPEAQAEATKRRRTAEIQAIRTATTAEAQAARFTNQMVAYQAAPQVFATRGYLQALTQGASAARKYVIAATNTQDVIQINLEDRLRPGLEDVVIPPAKPK